MKALDLNTICKVLKIEPIKENPKIEKITTSIRMLDSNTVIFNLKPINRLNEKKLSQLSHCYIVTDQPLLKSETIVGDQMLYVTDIEQAYRDFITFYRGLFHFPVVAVTGTCGKTTTKEIIKQVLEKNFNVVGTRLSINALRFNHDYLMSIDDDTNYGVFETALTHPGNIIYSSHFFKPDIGVITNIGIDHLNVCKTLENYIKTKGEMLAALQYKGTLIINQDDENIKKLDFSSYKGTIVTFGKKTKSDFYATDIQFAKNGMKFNLHHKGKNYNTYIPGYGEHNVYNALAAIAVLYTLGFKIEEVIPLLKEFKHISNHVEFNEGINGSLVIDDTWSSNPTSVKAALNVVKNIPKKKIVVLGKIAYLGKHDLEQCKEIGKMIADNQIDYLIVIDHFSKQVGIHAAEYGMNPNHIIYCTSKEEIIKNVTKLASKDTVILFKTSMLDSSLNHIVKYFIKKQKPTD